MGGSLADLLILTLKERERERRWSSYRSVQWQFLLLKSQFRFGAPRTPPHAPIVIVGDSDFIPANGVTGGTGTSSDPFIIEGWEMDAEIAAGIPISGTTTHFVIRNVNISRATPLPNQYGIYLNHVVNGSIENSNISGGLVYGIYIFSQSSNISIPNCSFEASTHYNNQYNNYMRDSSLISAFLAMRSPRYQVIPVGELSYGAQIMSQCPALYSPIAAPAYGVTSSVILTHTPSQSIIPSMGSQYTTARTPPGRSSTVSISESL